MPYSRATTAQWLRMPPVSVTTAAAVANSGVQGGARGDQQTAIEPRQGGAGLAQLVEREQHHVLGALEHAGSDHATTQLEQDAADAVLALEVDPEAVVLAQDVADLCSVQQEVEPL